jgi:glycine cleavage system H lipoate-binding protein
MAFIEKFLGKRVEIPEDRNYHVKQGLWATSTDQKIVFGLTEPALVLMGGINDLDWLVLEGQAVVEEEDVVFAITGKIQYIHTPVKGYIHFNHNAKENPSLVSNDPYQAGWLFEITLDASKQGLPQSLVDHQRYRESLHATEGFKNPEGLKGGVSGICKAVYSGIRDQKI